MVFASLVFLYIFLPLNLILYYTARDTKKKNIILVVFSLLFYAWGEPVWVLLLMFSAFVDYTDAKVIEKYRGRLPAKLALAASLIIDIGIFVVFKYSSFFIGNINSIFGASLTVPNFALPIGISFYTFQTVAYVIDVYRGDVKAQDKYYKYLLFLSMYFQLVAGPIVRYEYVARDIDTRRSSAYNISCGIERFICGLAKKVLIANVAGEFVNSYMGANASGISVVGAWFGMVMYTVQLYFDFSAYSDMAIGLGKMFGFSFPENFNYPYVSKNVSEFWRRWHITLGSFFKDYVYIPLGGNRKHVYRNLLIVWALTGFWHGASWNFIIWGLYNGALIMLERKFKSFFDRLPRIVSHIYLLLAVNFGFVFFYFWDIGDAFSYFRAMFGGYGNVFIDLGTQTTFVNNIFFVIVAFALCTPIFRYVKKFFERLEIASVGMLTAVNTAKYLLLAALLFFSTAGLAGNSFNPFLYFQF